MQKHPFHYKHQLVPGLLLLTCLALTVLCYWPSLSGPFIFDDLPNLQTLAKDGGLNSFWNFIQFAGGNESGPLGRPISMLSFAANAQNWPADPRPFRITNLGIHLLCGLLIFILSRQLFAAHLRKEPSVWLALCCAALWLAHPLLVSTTAYVVQRMAQLSSLFMLAGLLCYLQGRTRLLDKPNIGWCWIIGGMGLFGTLAILSKENGVLLPLYALVIELTVFVHPSIQQPAQRKHLIAVLLAPTLLLAAYLVPRFLNLEIQPAGRDFTIGERLLTQAAVLAEYLRLAVLPKMAGLGVMQDGFPIPHGLFDPPATAIFMALHATLVTAGLLLRKRLPYISLGILWFYAGHSLEAGPLSLELYFEHRNYLPLLGVILAAVGLWPVLSERLRRIAPIVFAFFLGLCYFITWQSAIVWGDERLLIYTNAKENPESVRAQLHFINQTTEQGQWQQSLSMLRALHQEHPQHGATIVSLLLLECQTGNLQQNSFSRTLLDLKNAEFDSTAPATLRQITESIRKGRCKDLTLMQNLALFDAALGNPAATGRKDYLGALQYYRAELLTQMKRMGQAIQALDAAYEAKREIEIRLTQVAWLVEYGRLEAAQYYLDLARQHKERRPWINHINHEKLDRWQAQLDELKKQANTSSSTQ